MSSTPNATECDILVEYMNSRMTYIYTPILIYLGVTMVLGTLGNFFVAYIYFCKFTETSTHMLIVALSVCDFLACAVCIPIEITWLHFSFTFHSDIMCHLAGSALALIFINSDLIVTIITIDRYRLICQPLKPKFTVQDSRKFIALSIMASLICGLPAGFVYNKQKRMVGECGNIGEVCSLIYFESSAYSLIYCAAIASMCTCMFIFVFTLYFLIGMRIRKLYFKRKKRAMELLEYSQNITSHTAENKSNNGTRSAAHLSPNIGVKKSVLHPTRTNLILFIITAIWTISYIPFISGTFWKLFTENFDNTASYRNQRLYHFLTLSYYITSAINPYFYGLFSQQFRIELRLLLSKLFCFSSQ